jgi:hypothetical protein
VTRSTASAKSSSAENWFVATADNRTVEYELDDLIAAIQSGLVRSRDLVWRQGMSDWLEMDRVPLLRMIAGPLAAPTEPPPATAIEPPLAVSLEPAAAPIVEPPVTAPSESVQATLPTEPPLAVPTERPPATPIEPILAASFEQVQAASPSEPLLDDPPEKPAQDQSIDETEVTAVQPLVDLLEDNEWAIEPQEAPKPEPHRASLSIHDLVRRGSTSLSSVSPSTTPLAQPAVAGPTSPEFAVARLSSPPLPAQTAATQDEDRRPLSRLSERAPRKPISSVAPKPSPPIMVDRTRLPERVTVKPVATPYAPAPDFWIARGERVPVTPAPKPAESVQSLASAAAANTIAVAQAPSVSSNPAEPAQPLAPVPAVTAVTATQPLSVSSNPAEPAQPVAPVPAVTAVTATQKPSVSLKPAEPDQPPSPAPTATAVTATQKPSMRPKPAKPVRSQAPPPAGKVVAAVRTSLAPASDTPAVVSAVSVTPKAAERVQSQVLPSNLVSAVPAAAAQSGNTAASTPAGANKSTPTSPLAQSKVTVAAASADVPQQAKPRVAEPSISTTSARPVAAQTPVVEESVGSVLPSVTSLYPDTPQWRRPRRQLYYVSGGIIAAAVAIFVSLGSRPTHKTKLHAAAASSMVTAVAEPKDSQPVPTAAAQSVSPPSTAQDITTLPTTADLTASKPTKKSAVARPSTPRSGVATRPSSRQASEFDDTTPPMNRSTQKAKTESAAPASTAESTEANSKKRQGSSSVASWDQGTVEHRSWMSPGF